MPLCEHSQETAWEAQHMGVEHPISDQCHGSGFVCGGFLLWFVAGFCLFVCFYQIFSILLFLGMGNMCLL